MGGQVFGEIAPCGWLAGCPGWRSKLQPSLVAVPGPLTLDHGKEIRWGSRGRNYMAELLLFVMVFDMYQEIFPFLK
jgi:hypothetical protein